jgi:hypothetical protein
MDPHPFQLIQHITSSHHVNRPAKNSPMGLFPQIQKMIHVCHINKRTYPLPSIARIPYTVGIPHSIRAGIAYNASPMKWLLIWNLPGIDSFWQEISTCHGTSGIHSVPHLGDRPLTDGVERKAVEKEQWSNKTSGFKKSHGHGHPWFLASHPSFSSYISIWRK